VDGDAVSGAGCASYKLKLLVLALVLAWYEVCRKTLLNN